MSSQENNTPDLNLDEFLPMPGADDILTAPESAKTTVFSKPKDLDTTFLETKAAIAADAGEKEEPKINVEAAKEALTQILDNDLLDEDTKSSPGRPKVDKSGLVDTFSKLIEEGMIVPFDDEKPLDEYSTKDWKELLQANFEERENKVKQQVPASFFNSLPDELKAAYKYISDGGEDLKGLFRALSHVEEVRQLDPRDEQDQEQIARQYLRATNFGTEDEIEEEIETWKDLGNLGKKANQFKPKLDKMQEQVINYQLQQQEQFKVQQEEAANQYSYKSQIMQAAKNEVAQDTVRKLKTEEARKLSSTQMTEDEDRKPAKRTIPRQQNIFKR